MSNFIEFDHIVLNVGERMTKKILINKYHITSITPDSDDTGSIINLNNNTSYHVSDKYDYIKSVLYSKPMLSEG